MKKLIDHIEWFVELLGGLARICVLALVLFVATNVILRYFFSIGPVGLQELEWHLISPIALLGLAYAMKHRADVRVDVFYERFSIKKRALVDLVGSILTVAVGAYIAWLSFPYVEQSFHLNEGSPDPGGLSMRYLLKAFIPLGFLLLVLQGLADSMNSLLVLRGQSLELDGDEEAENVG